MPGYEWMPTLIPVVWLAFTLALAAYLTTRRTHETEPHHAGDPTLTAVDTQA